MQIFYKEGTRRVSYIKTSIKSEDLVDEKGRDKLANLLTITVSLTNIILLFTIHIYQYNYSNLMIGLILLYYLYLFYQKRKYLYQKFLLERYLYHLNYPKLKIIKNINQMYKNKSHIIYHHKKYKEEAIVLNQYFKNKNKRSIQ